MLTKIKISLYCFIFLTIQANAQITPAPERQEGEGPFPQLIIRGATLINGNGAPPMGPVDIVVENNRITQIRSVGFPGVEIDPERRMIDIYFLRH